MISIISLIAIFAGGIGFSVLYILSTQPVRFSRKMGEKSFPFCGRLRIVASFFEMVVLAGYLGYRFLTPGVPLFPWPWWSSLLVGAILAVPCCLLMFIGLKNAGKEALSPDPSHIMYGGLYNKIRHPQAVGEGLLFPITGLMLHSPVLAVGSVFWLPVFHLFCLFEERDLVLRYGDSFREYQRRVGMYFPKKKRRKLASR